MFGLFPEISIQTWNRIGIILQTLSFVMVTPQLIGMERLAQFQEWLKEYLIKELGDKVAYAILDRLELVSEIKTINNDSSLKEYEKSRSIEQLMFKQQMFFLIISAILAIAFTLTIYSQTISSIVLATPPSEDNFINILVVTIFLLLFFSIFFFIIFFVVLFIYIKALTGMLLIMENIINFYNHLNNEHIIINWLFAVGILLFFISNIILFLVA